MHINCSARVSESMKLKEESDKRKRYITLIRHSIGFSNPGVKRKFRKTNAVRTLSYGSKALFYPEISIFIFIFFQFLFLFFDCALDNFSSGDLFLVWLGEGKYPPLAICYYYYVSFITGTYVWRSSFGIGDITARIEYNA